MSIHLLKSCKCVNLAWGGLISTKWVGNIFRTWGLSGVFYLVWEGGLVVSGKGVCDRIIWGLSSVGGLISSKWEGKLSHYLFGIVHGVVYTRVGGLINTKWEGSHIYMGLYCVDIPLLTALYTEY
jgi:hypothetical protein